MNLSPVVFLPHNMVHIIKNDKRNSHIFRLVSSIIIGGLLSYLGVVGATENHAGQTLTIIAGLGGGWGGLKIGQIAAKRVCQKFYENLYGFSNPAYYFDEKTINDILAANPDFGVENRARALTGPSETTSLHSAHSIQIEGPETSDTQNRARALTSPSETASLHSAHSIQIERPKTSDTQNFAQMEKLLVRLRSWALMFEKGTPLRARYKEAFMKLKVEKNRAYAQKLLGERVERLNSTAAIANPPSTITADNVDGGYDTFTPSYSQNSTHVQNILQINYYELTGKEQHIPLKIPPNILDEIKHHEKQLQEITPPSSKSSSTSSLSLHRKLKVRI